MDDDLQIQNVLVAGEKLRLAGGADRLQKLGPLDVLDFRRADCQRADLVQIHAVDFHERPRKIVVETAAPERHVARLVRHQPA